MYDLKQRLDCMSDDVNLLGAALRRKLLTHQYILKIAA